MQCLVDRDALAIAMAERKLTLQTASAGATLQSIAKTHGDSLPIKALSGIILVTTEFFSGTGTQMTSSQSVQTAALLLDSYPAETIEDVVLCLKNAKSGKYGKIYARIDGQLIFTWFSQYLDEKYAYLEQVAHNKKMEYNEQRMAILEPLAQTMIGALASLEKKDEKDATNSTVIRLTDEQHRANFKKYIKTLPLNELQQLRDEYQVKDRTHGIWNHLDEYITAIEQQINTFNKTNQ